MIAEAVLVATWYAKGLPNPEAHRKSCKHGGSALHFGLIVVWEPPPPSCCKRMTTTKARTLGRFHLMTAAADHRIKKLKAALRELRAVVPE